MAETHVEITQEMDVDVVVIGAGLSGLSAAYHLTKKDPSIRVLVVEAKERVGGRTFTKQLKSASGYDNWDLGGQWVGRTQVHIMSLLDELGIGTYKQYIQGSKLMKLGEERVRAYKSNIPKLSLFSLLDLHFFLERLEKCRTSVSPIDPYHCPQAEEWDNMTLETFKQKYIWTKATSDCIDAAVRVIAGMECSQMSALHFIMYSAAAGGIKALTEATENTGQEFKIQGGSQQVSKLLAEKIGEANITFSDPVNSIHQNDDSVLITTASLKKIHCSRVIMAIPPKQASHIQYYPPLPADKALMFNRMIVGYIVKFIVTYSNAFWKEDGYSGEIVSYGGRTTMEGCDNGPLSVIYDATSFTGNPALVGFICGKQAAQWSKIDPQKREAAVIADIAEFLGQKALNYLEYAEKNWAEEPYNGGGPISASTPGIMAHFAYGLRKPFGRVHLAGTETATVWCGFMNGAVQAGTRAANEVLYHIRPQVVTAEDLLDTAYGPSSSTTSRQYSGKTGNSFVCWSLGIGAMIIVAFVAQKTYMKIVQ